MPRYDAPSRCSGPATPTLRWYGNPQCAVGDDLDTAVSVLMDAISSEARLWNPWTRAMVSREFRSRLVRASQGKLAPLDEVKPVDVVNPPPMYEIRWQDVAVTERLPDGKQWFGKVVVRMYHSEPSEVPDYFVAHHAHEKDVEAPDVNGAQNAEIRTAYGWYQHGHPTTWGIAPTTGSI